MKEKGPFKSTQIAQFVKKLDNAMNGRKYVLIWDNASVHKAAPVKEMIEYRDVDVAYNLPYRCDFMGIEIFWGNVKRIYR